MTFKELCTTLNEKETRVKHWLYCLRRAGLVAERERKLKNQFTEEEVDYFRKIHQFLEDGCESVPEAIRLMKENTTPKEALEAHKRSQQHIEQLQSKVSAQRKKLAVIQKESWWNKVTQWFSNFLKRGDRDRGNLSNES